MDNQLPPVDFSFFLSTLSMQAMVDLGEVENPLTKKKEKNLPQAKYIIDTLAMLEDKTKGNLTDKERKVLNDILYGLRMRYVESDKG